MHICDSMDSRGVLLPHTVVQVQYLGAGLYCPGLVFCFLVIKESFSRFLRLNHHDLSYLSTLETLFGCFRALPLQSGDEFL